MKASQNKQLDFLLVNLIVQKQKPNYEVARQHKLKYSVANNTNKFQLIHSRQYSKFGPGPVLFFQMLKYLTLLFGLLFINSIPMLLCNLKGDGLQLYSQKQNTQFSISIMKLSLANQPFFKVNPNSNEVQNAQNHTQINRTITIINDVYLTCIIIVFFIWWDHKSKDIVQKVIKSRTLPSYKTLIVSNISQFQQQKLTQRCLIQQSQQSQLQTQVKKHFQKFGQVSEVAVVYDYKQFLINLREFIELCKKYSDQIQSKKKISLYSQITEKYSRLKQSYFENTSQCFRKKHTAFFPIKFLVTFQNIQTRNRVKSLYKYKIHQQQLFINNHIPKVQKCRTEPMSIIWQNFHLKDATQFKKTIFFGIFISIILLSALMAIFLISIKMAQLVDTKNQSSLDTAKQFLDKQINIPTYFQALKSNNPKTVYNFCSQIDYKSFHIQYYSLCEEYFTNFSQKIFSMLLLSTMIAIINFLFNKIIYALADYRRHRTITERNNFLIGNIFFVYFVNTVLLILLIRAQFGKFQDEKVSSLVDIVKQIFPHFSTLHKIQTYSELSRKWYMHIGTQLLINYAVSLILLPWLYIFVYFIYQKVKCLLAKLSKTQAQMNETILQQQFDFQTFYALILNSFFFCLTFSTGIPIFYLFGVLSFGSLYVSSKITFQYFSKVPIPFDHSLNEFIFKLLILGLILHQFSALLFVYVEDVFQNQNKQNSQHLQKRIIYLIMSSLIFIFYLYKKQISNLVFKSKSKNKESRIKFSNEWKRTEKIINVNDHIQKSQQAEIGKLEYLKSYVMQENQAYKQICYALLVFKKVVIQHRDVTKQFLPVRVIKQKQTVSQLQNSRKQQKLMNLQDLSYREQYGNQFLIE